RSLALPKPPRSNRIHGGEQLMNHCTLGLTLSALELYSACWDTGTPVERMPTSRWLLPGPNVLGQPAAGPLLPFTLVGTRSLRAGSRAWVLDVMRSVRERWLPALPKPVGRLMVATAGSLGGAERAEV